MSPRGGQLAARVAVWNQRRGDGSTHLRCDHDVQAMPVMRTAHEPTMSNQGYKVCTTARHSMPSVHQTETITAWDLDFPHVKSREMASCSAWCVVVFSPVLPQTSLTDISDIDHCFASCTTTQDEKDRRTHMSFCLFACWKNSILFAAFSVFSLHYIYIYIFLSPSLSSCLS